MITYTPAQARQILAAAQSAQKQLTEWVEFPEILPPLDAALTLLKGLVDGSIVVRETPTPSTPNTVTHNVGIPRGDGITTTNAPAHYISAGRYRINKEAQK